ncbi:MAG: M23 family metallopeptidase [Devosia sp.]
MFGLLLATNVATGVAFLMAPDISRLMGDQNDLIVSAYEDRIATMRIEVDRLHSRQFAQAGDLNLQLQELAQQQEVLSEQHHYVRQLAARAEELGLQTAAAPSPGVDPMITGSARVPGPDDVAETARSVTSMLEDSRLAMAAISAEAKRSTDAIVSELQSLGRGTRLPAAEAVGGPLLPARPGEDAKDLVEDANAVAEALARFKAAREAIATAPVHRPIDASARSSSGFGNRTDPFTRGKAFHAGIDFAAPTGTVVTSAGDGRVSFVGVRSGYGKVIEITHAQGLVTRYAHLSAFIAREGQSVRTGTPIAKVGSTGRSTGPHLHFEVRKADRPLDPSRFLAAGRRLARLMGTPA